MMNSLLEKTMVGVAQALFINRFHVLRMTEVVRLKVDPEKDSASFSLPIDLDNELKQQSIDYVLTCMPEEFRPAINQAKTAWLNPS